MPSSILIVGAGIAGPTLATLLLSTPSPPSITLLERSPGTRTQGQNVDVRGAGAAVICRLGLEDAIRAHTTREEGAQFVDAANRVWAGFAADKTGRARTGTSDIEILRGTLARLCNEKCMQASEEGRKRGKGGVEVLYGEWVEEVEEDTQRGKVDVVLGKSGERKSFDLVVAADGLMSKTRRIVFGEAAERTSMHGLGVYGGFFSLPKGGQDTMWRRWYRAPGKVGIMIRPHEEKDMSTVFMFVVNDTDERFNKVAKDGRKNVDEQKALMAEYFGNAGWECPRVIREMHAADDFYYAPVAQVRLDKWSKGRVVLLGDAGYCASPISGMGTTLAFVGAYNLAGALIQHPDDHEAAFKQYEAKMRPVVEKAQKLPFGGRVFHLFHPETAWGILLFNFFVAFLHYSGVGKLLFMLKGPPANEVPVEEYGFPQL